MPQVVDASNYVEFVQTGKVAEFKPPEAPPASTTPGNGSSGEAKGNTPSPPAQTRGADGKFTSSSEGDKTTSAPDAKASPKATPGEDDDADLPEKVRLKINAKHRQAKEAEEFARSEFRARTAAEQRAERLQQQLDAQSERSRPAAAEGPKEPQPDDFKTVAEYARALAKHMAAEERAAEKAEQAREAAEREEAERMQAFGKRVAAASVKYDDFESVLNSIKGTDLERVPKDVTEYIQESEQGADLLYHLAKNPDVLDRLRKLSPRRFIAELGKLEAKWEPSSAPKGDASATPPKLSELASATQPAVSKAPAPIAPLDTAGVAPVSKKPEEMSVAELREFRRQEASQKRAAGR